MQKLGIQPVHIVKSGTHCITNRYRCQPASLLGYKCFKEGLQHMSWGTRDVMFLDSKMILRSITRAIIHSLEQRQLWESGSMRRHERRSGD